MSISPIAESHLATTLPQTCVARRASSATAAVLLGLGFAAAMALRLALIFRYRIDSDETQHLHVVWGWSHHLLPYRDFFDNHMPLFHILSLPLLRLAGERPEALILGRIAMLPLFALMVLLTWRIGLSCYPRRAVIIATVIGIFAPDFFLCSLEFRPDVLWATCWLATLAILVTAPVTTRRAALAGLAFGIAASVSAKSLLLAVILCIAAAVALVLIHDASLTLRNASKRALSFAGAALVLPSLIAIYFAARGAWKPFIDCTITHNAIPSEHPLRLLALPVFVAAIVLVTRRIMRDSDTPPDVLRRRVFLFVAAYGYAALMISMWPIIETEHWLPFYPVAAVAALALLPRSDRSAAQFAIAILVLELFWIARSSTPWRNQVTQTAALIEQTLKLSAPNETVLDLKGEMLFRRRAFYYVLEKITRRAISTGRLRDTIAADVVRTHTMVAVRDDPGLPRVSRLFLLRNFVNVGCLRVAGMIVPRSRTFQIEIPGDYSLVSSRGEFRGMLDGTRYAGPRYLTAGSHTVAPSAAFSRTAILWARAASLGFSPFNAGGTR